MLLGLHPIFAGKATCTMGAVSDPEIPCKGLSMRQRISFRTYLTAQNMIKTSGNRKDYQQGKDYYDALKSA